MKSKMYALVKSKAKLGLELQGISVPETGSNDVKIKIRKTAICGTDVHIYNWDSWSQTNVKPPLQIGHEYVGEIVEKGNQVTNFSIGETVSGEGHIVCGVCRNCRAGNQVLCGHTKGVGVHRPGCFAEYLVIPQQNVVKILPGISEDIVAIFDPLGNAVHTALTYRLVGEDVLVTGAGPIGIMAAAVAKHCGARHVIITDINEYRLNLAAKVVSNVVPVNVAHQNLEDVMHKLGMQEGFDVGFEMSGAAPAINSMIKNMITGGKIAMLGFQGPQTMIDWDKVIMGSLTLRGIYGREIFETWYKMMAMIQSGFDVSAVITHQFDFRDYEQGFSVMNSGKSGKVLLDWTGID